MNLIEKINNHDYLYLDSLIDIGEMKVELLISEASTECWDGKADNLDDLTEIERAEVVKRRLCKKYKITFDNYICYSITNESFTGWDDYEKFLGKLFRIYSKSRFLDYIPNAVEMFIIENTLEEKIEHYGILCLNNIIHVATCQKPTIEQL